MKVVTWNLFNLMSAEEFLNDKMAEDLGMAVNYVKNRREYYISKLKSYETDVFCANEVVNKSEFEEISKAVLGDDCVIYFGQPDKRGSKNAVSIRSNFDISINEVQFDNIGIPDFRINYPEITNPYLTQRRGFIKLSYANIDIFVVHLKSQLPGNLYNDDGTEYESENSIDEAKRHILGEISGLAESYALRKDCSRLISEGRHVIICGDYNTSINTRRMSVLRGYRESEDEMKDVFPVNNREIYSYIFNNEKTRFDHLLASPGAMTLINDAKIDTSDLVEKQKGVWHDFNILGSDHAPIIFDLK